MLRCWFYLMFGFYVLFGFVLHRLVGLRLLRLCPFLVSEVEQEIYSARDSVPRPCNGFHPWTFCSLRSVSLLLCIGFSTKLRKQFPCRIFIILRLCRPHCCIYSAFGDKLFMAATLYYVAIVKNCYIIAETAGGQTM